MWTTVVSAQLLQSYEPVRVLGVGAFGMVIQALSRKTGEPVAIKRFPSRGGDRRKFYRELKLLLSLAHPNIVRCVDMCDSDEDASELVLEFADKGSVRDLMLDKGRLDEALALDILVQVARAIQHAHAEGVLHRDIKPENILVFSGAPRPTYKMADFGIAKLLGDLQVSMTSIGTPAYMAPEQFYDEYDYASDVYSLGMVLHEMLHGEAAFKGSPSSIFRQHLEQPIPMGDHVAPDMADLIRRLVHKDRHQRPPVTEALEQLLNLRRRRGQADTDHQGRLAAAPGNPANSDGNSAEALFGDMFGEEEEPQPAIEPPVALGLLETRREDDAAPAAEEDLGEAPAGPIGDEPGPHAPPSGASAFLEGFEDAAEASLAVPSSLSEIAREETRSVGRISVRQAWSRVIDPKALGIVNPDDGGPLIIVASAGLHEIASRGTKGRVLFEGPVSAVGTPVSGVLPFLSGNTVRVLRGRKLLDKQWELDGDLAGVAIAPGCGAIAITVGSRVFCHAWDGEQLWVGRFENAGEPPFISYDEAGRLMVVCAAAGSQGVLFHAQDGSLVGEQWLPGRILAATRCRGAEGAWVLVARRSGNELHRVCLEGSRAACRIQQELEGMAGAQDWVCGVDGEGQVIVVDPSTGESTSRQPAGRVLGIERGPSPSEIYVVEERSEVLRYLSCSVVEREQAPTQPQEAMVP